MPKVPQAPSRAQGSGPSPLDGFDPLAADSTERTAALTQVVEESNRRIILNILKSYTGYFDIFSELLQNALDALQTRQRHKEPGFKPRIWITIDVSSGLVRVVDNGIGMNDDEFRYCLRPNVSFKRQADLRGHKGVGATFLAYGFSFIKLQSKKNSIGIGAILRQGRQWAEDTSNTVPRPRFQAIDFTVPELTSEVSGTGVEIKVGASQGERPRNLGWIGAQTADQWLNLLRIKSPLGGVYLTTPPFQTTVSLTVKSAEGSVTEIETSRAEYYYPHEIPNLKGQSLTDIRNALASVPGDAATQFMKIGSEFKRLDCLYEIWTKDELLREDSYFATAIDEEQRLLIERHNVTVYAAFLRSAKLWGEFNDSILKLRRGQRIMHGGVQIASDFMVQGDLGIIPLTSTIGYQANSHVIVHFTDGNPDMGRKTFQPELKELADILAVRCVNTMKRFLQHMKPDTGAQTLMPDRELHDWKRTQEQYRDTNALAFSVNSNRVALISVPQQKQDVIALFHELVGMQVLKGFNFYATSQSDRYDSLFFMDYVADDSILFDGELNRLGINRLHALPYTTEPKVLEYKYDFDSLVRDFDKEEKFAKHIDLVVCWSVGTNYREKYYLQSLLIGDEGSSRKIQGATHQAFPASSNQCEFELIVLDDLLRWIRDPADEEARQKRVYRDS
jgi:Histidine kinase-, DNA gyrase B-, and HSP90-like ATPase